MMHKVSHVKKSRSEYFLCHNCNTSWPSLITMENDHVGIKIDVTTHNMKNKR